MSTLIVVLGIVDVMLAILLVVAGMARMDRRYAARVRAEYDRKSILRGHDVDRDRS